MAILQNRLGIWFETSSPLTIEELDRMLIIMSQAFEEQGGCEDRILSGWLSSTRNLPVESVRYLCEIDWRCQLRIIAVNRGVVSRERERERESNRGLRWIQSLLKAEFEDDRKDEHRGLNRVALSIGCYPIYPAGLVAEVAEC